MMYRIYRTKSFGNGLGRYVRVFRRHPLGYGGTSQATVLLPLGFVVAVVTARYGDAPTAPPRPRPKSPVAAPFPILKQAKGRCLTELLIHETAFDALCGVTGY